MREKVLELELGNGNRRNMEAGIRGRPIRVGASFISLFGRKKRTAQKGFGTQGSVNAFNNCDYGSQINHGYLANGIREGETEMTTAQLMKEFTAKSAEVLQQVSRLNDILQDLTPENCPLSPCEGCVLVKCTLRRIVN